MKKEQRDIDRKIKKMIVEAIAAANKKNAGKTKRILEPNQEQILNL